MGRAGGLSFRNCCMVQIVLSVFLCDLVLCPNGQTVWRNHQSLGFTESSLSEGHRKAGASVGKSFINHRKQVDRLLGRCEFFTDSVIICLSEWPYFINRTVNAVMVIF